MTAVVNLHSGVTKQLIMTTVVNLHSRVTHLKNWRQQSQQVFELSSSYTTESQGLSRAIQVATAAANSDSGSTIDAMEEFSAVWAKEYTKAQVAG